MTVARDCCVDRKLFSERVRGRLEADPRITIHREEVTHLDEHSQDTITVLATGPLTSPALTAELTRLTGADHLAFYDSISPIVDASTIDRSKVYLAARWDKGTADYINCPFTREDYDTFLEALTTAEKIEQKPWEQLPPDGRPDHLASAAQSKEPGSATNNPTHLATSSNACHSERNEESPYLLPPKPGAPSMTALPSWVGSSGSISGEPREATARSASTLQYFEGCLPIEETARRGRNTLRFGPMKPAGLTDPKTGRWPYAVVQLRQENLRADSYNLVGFQNHLKFAEQARVLRLIPGLEHATFLRYGQIHRNTYIHAPSLLTETLQLRAHPNILIAGQLAGVEGYTESIASGLLAGRYAAALARGFQPTPAPRISANGSLTHYITHADHKKFQPANITFDLLPPLEEDLRRKIRDKKERHRLQCERALRAWTAWLAV